MRDEAVEMNAAVLDYTKVWLTLGNEQPASPRFDRIPTMNHTRRSDLQATRSALPARNPWSGFPADSADEPRSTWMSDACGQRQSSSTKLTCTTVISLRYGQNRPGAYITR